MSNGDNAVSAPSVPKLRWLNAWWWMLAALAATGCAFIWARCVPEGRVPLEIVQVSLVFLGLLAAGGAVWIRCSAAEPAGLSDLPAKIRQAALPALAGIHGVIGLAVTGWLLAKVGGARFLPGDAGGTLLLWLLSAPWCIFSAFVIFQHAGLAKPLSPRFETAVVVTQAGVTALLASWALYWGAEFRDSWDSLRLFLAVVAAVAFMAAPMIAANSLVRRLAFTALLLFHFTAVVAAAVSAPPGPWIFGQGILLVFRPYLDFLYLNNAYRFYAPEPGPASQLWFRIEYQKGDQTLRLWKKLPEVDDRGGHSYPTSVQYTRCLALTENVSRTGPMPPMAVPEPGGKVGPAKFFQRRDDQSPFPNNEGKLGYKPVENSLMVPFHPDSMVPNYQAPSLEAQQLLKSYARHILNAPHPTDPEATPVAVKIYRVQHRILGAEFLARGMDPRDGTLYLPYYVGRFNTAGELTDPEDAFLYWLLPILRENENDPKSRLKCYFFKHAGDSDLMIRQSPLPR